MVGLVINCCSDSYLKRLHELPHTMAVYISYDFFQILNALSYVHSTKYVDWLMLSEW